MHIFLDWAGPHPCSALLPMVTIVSQILLTLFHEDDHVITAVAARGDRDKTRARGSACHVLFHVVRGRYDTLCSCTGNHATYSWTCVWVLEIKTFGYVTEA